MATITRKKKVRQSISLVLVFMLIITLIPIVPNGVSAAALMNLVYPSGQGATANNFIVTSNQTTTINGEFSGLDPALIRYEVEQKTTGQKFESTLAPLVTPPNRFRFDNIPLFPGLNEVRAKYISGGINRIETIFIFYNDNPNLFNLQIQGRNINAEQNIINHPVSSGTTNIVSLQVQGLAPNTNTIIFKNNSILQTHPQAELAIDLGAHTDNFFAMIPLRSGINELSFELLNNTGKKVVVNRTVILNTLSAAGLAPYNLQSHYGTGGTPATVRKFIPMLGDVDFKYEAAGSPNINNLAFRTITVGNGNVRISGSIVLNVSNPLPFHKRLEFGPANATNMYYNELDFDIRFNNQSILIPADQKSLTPVSRILSGETGVKAQIRNVQSGLAAFNANVSSYQDGLAGYNGPYRAEDVTRYNSVAAARTNLVNSLTTLSTTLNELHTALNGTGITSTLDTVATALTNHRDSINTAVSSMSFNVNDDHSVWGTPVTTGLSTIGTQTTGLNTIVNEATGTLNTQLNTIVQSFESVTQTNFINLRVEDGFQIIDFITPEIPASRFQNGGNWVYGEYTIQFIPRIYSNNSANAQAYLLNPTDSIMNYRFNFVDSARKQILGVNNFNTNEFILEHNQPYRVDDSVFNIGVYHANLVTGDHIRVFAQQAPYTKPVSPTNPSTPQGTQIATAAVTTGSNLNVIPLQNLPAGNVLLNIYVWNGTSYVEVASKELMVTKTPLVTIKDAQNNFITHNKNYIYNEKAPGAQSMTNFLDSLFNSVTIELQGVALESNSNNNVGRVNNPLKVKVNNTEWQIYYDGAQWRQNGAVGLSSPFISATLDSGNNMLRTLRINLRHGTILNTTGKNTIQVEFREGNKTIINTIDFNVITEGNPLINQFFVANQGTNYFPVSPGQPVITESERVSIRGSFENADRVEILVNGNTIYQANWTDSPAQWNFTQTTNLEYIRFDGFSAETSTNKRFVNPMTTSPKPTYQFNILDLHLDSKVTGVNLDIFTIRVEVSKGTTTYSENLVIERKRPIFTVLAPYRSVVNNNFQTVIIKSQYATAVKMGRNDLEKVKLERGNSQNRLGEYVLDWIEDHLYDSNYVNMVGEYVFYAEVPLKAGRNNIALTIEMPGVSHRGNIEVFYAALPNVGAVFKTDMSKTNINPKELGNQISLTFPRGTILSPKSSKLAGTLLPYNLPDFWHDKSILIGIADVYTGKVNRDIRRTNVLLRNMLSASNRLDFFNYASNMFYVDAGTVNQPGGRLPYEGSMVTSRVERDVIVPSHRGTLTLSYNSNIVRDAASHLTVMYHPGFVIDGQTEWVNLGGVVDTGKKQITVPFDDFGYYVVMHLRSTFDDVQFHPWAKRELETMFAKGIMANQSLSRFGSDMPITRGEFITIIVKALNIPLNDGPYNSEGAIKFPTRQTFTDVMPNVGLPYWDYKYIETAARAGIVQGVAPRRFAPNDLLTREQAATMLARATEARVLRTPEQALTTLQKDFIDANQISYYALQSVQAIARSGIVVGKTTNNPDGTTSMRFDPHSNLTRAEAATIARRMMQQLKLLPDPL